jgi:hypothetical protein
MPYPNFIIIGAAKCGTSALFAQLSEHPDVFACRVKEPRFFAFEGQPLRFTGPGDDWSINRASVTDRGDYLALFDGSNGYSAIGEASPMYLQSSEAPARIHHQVPNARLIAILRDPTQRAYSDFLARRRNGTEPITDFMSALRAEEDRRRRHWSPHAFYLDKGRYYTYLKPYYDLFDRRKLMVVFYEDMCRDPVGTFRGVCEFLGIDSDFVPDVATRYAASGNPRSLAAQRVLNSARRSVLLRAIARPIPQRQLRRAYARIQNRNLADAGPIPGDAQRFLKAAYRPEIQGIATLTGRDLTSWT